MRELRTEELAMIKKIELDILLEFDRLCKKNGINYSLTGGTLLGAIRHKGFIPWDDDIDVVMLQDDYAKFLKVANEQLSEKYYIANLDADRFFGYPPITKIMAKHTLMKEIKYGDSKAQKGVFIDIFPLYGCSNSKRIRSLNFRLIQRLAKDFRCRNGFYFETKGLKDFVYKVRRMIYSAIPLSVYKTSFRLLLDYSQNCAGNKYVISYGGVYGAEKESLKREWFDEYVQVEFEGHFFTSIAKYDEYLKKHYGAYMELPPLECQIPHHYLDELYIDEKYWRFNDND